MRNESQLNVNVHQRAIRAEDRVRTDRRLQHSLDRPHEEPKEPWWSKYFKWEHHITVAGRTIEKGWVVPQPLGIALIVVMLGGVGSLYWRLTDKVAEQAQVTQQVREMLIRLDQRLLDKNEHDNQRFQQINDTVEGTKQHQAAVESLWNKQFAELKAQAGRR